MKKVWFSSSIWLKLASYTGFTFGGLCIHATGNLLKDEFDVFCYLVWCIWGARNKFIFENRHVSAIALIEEAGSLVAAFHSCSTKIQKFPSLGEGDKRWVPPRLGLLKLNTDAAYCQFTARAGYGCIIRNDLGQVVAFSCGRYEGALSAQHAEIKALKDGLLLAVSKGLFLDYVE